MLESNSDSIDAISPRTRACFRGNAFAAEIRREFPIDSLSIGTRLFAARSFWNFGDPREYALRSRRTTTSREIARFFVFGSDLGPSSKKKINTKERNLPKSHASLVIQMVRSNITTCDRGVSRP